MKVIWGILAIVIFVSSSSEALEFEATPASIEQGFEPTPVLELTCSHEGSGSLVFITIRKIVNGVLQNLATMRTSDTSPTIGDALPIGGSASFVREDGDLKSLTVQIPNPGPDDATKYFCRGRLSNRYFYVFKFLEVPLAPFDFDDLVGRILNLTAQVEALQNQTCTPCTANTTDPSDPGDVNATVIDMIDMLKEQNANLSSQLEAAQEHVDQLKTDVEQLEARLNTTEGVLQNITTGVEEAVECVNQLKENVTQIECRANETRNLLEVLDDTLFSQSDTTNGSTYLLSQYSPATFLNAESICESRGGSLVQIDSQEELTFIEEFLTPILSEKQYVLTGIVKNGTDGYINRDNSTADITSFFMGRPDNLTGDEDCVALVLNLFGLGGLGMDDVSCDFISLRDFEWIHAFLCEIPTATTDTCAVQ